MNQATFLVNQFLTNCIEAQEKGTEFHYAWLLILIALVGWKEPFYYQCMRTTNIGNMVPWYANLWHTPNKRRKTYNNVTFYVYFDTIMYIIEHTPRITTKMVETYQDIARFKEGMHHMYIQSKRDTA